MLNEVDVSKLEGTFVLLYKLNNDKVCRLLPVTDKILGKMLIEENVCVDVTVEDLRKCVRDKNIEVLNVYISSGGSILEKKLHFPILIDVYLMNAVKIRNRVVNSNVVGNIQDSKDWNLENSLKWLCSFGHYGDRRRYKNNLEVFIKDINLARYDSKDINDVMVMSIGRQEEFVRFALEDIEVLTSKKRGSPINKTPKSVYDIAKENHIQLDKSYVIVEKSSDGKYGKLQRVYDGENYNRRSIIEYATVSVDNIKAFMYAYDFKVLNAYLSKDTRLIIKKTYFPTIVVAYLYKIYFLGWKNFIDEYYYKEEIKERLNWLCKPYGSLSINCKNNFEVAILDEYFADCLNKKEFIDMLNMSKKNQYKFVQSMFEDIEKLCKR